MENKDAYIQYRFQRTLESLEEADILAEKKHWNAVVNSLYYACFYSVIALLIKNDISSQSHDSVRIQFGLHFIKTEIIDRKYGRFLSKLFDYRQKGDYGDMFDFNEITTLPLIVETKEFILEIKKHIDS